MGGALWDDGAASVDAAQAFWDEVEGQGEDELGGARAFASPISASTSAASGAAKASDVEAEAFWAELETQYEADHASSAPAGNVVEEQQPVGPRGFKRTLSASFRSRSVIDLDDSD